MSFGARIRGACPTCKFREQGVLVAPCLLTWVSKIKASKLLAAFSLSCFSRSRRVRSSSLWVNQTGIKWAWNLAHGPSRIALPHPAHLPHIHSTYFCTERASSSSGKSGRSKTASSTPISSTIFCFRAGFCFFSPSGAGGTPSGPDCPFSSGF